MSSDIDWFFEKENPWQDAYRALRRILMDTGLEEAQKWGVPCYMYKGKNVVLIHGFKE